jgi:hypothetical protein
MENYAEPIILSLQKLCTNWIAKNLVYFSGLNTIPVELIDVIYKQHLSLNNMTPNSWLLFLRAGVWGDQFHNESNSLLRDALKLEMFEAKISYGSNRPALRSNFRL